MKLVWPVVILLANASAFAKNVVRGDEAVPRRGVYEVKLTASKSYPNPYFDTSVRVTFTRPSGAAATVDGFFDGGRTYKARAYCDEVGQWTWTSESSDNTLTGKSGTFEVIRSELKGKLRIHPHDGRQFAYDDGSWFLHIGDTGYRFVTATEPRWREYIDQAARMGATKIRTWFCQARHDVQVLYAGGKRQQLNLPYWREIDRRVNYALDNHPGVMLHLILYGEDTEELRRYAQGDLSSHFLARYAQARFSAFPNVFWCISNDREIVADDVELTGRRIRRSTISQIGRDMAAREPWGTLLTNHQMRFSGYSHVGEPWNNVITIEDLDAVDGKVLLKYRSEGNVPVVNDEDRYENYRFPKHSRYFFRRLMWASLLSGGSATYGGLRTYEPYDGGLRGVQGYYDANAEGKLQQGAHDLVHIHKFFEDTGITLAGMEPDDGRAGGDPLRWKCIHDARNLIVYVANPTAEEAEIAGESTTVPSVTLNLSAGSYSLRWFDPSTGVWRPGGQASGGARQLFAPGPGDWVLLARAQSGH